MKKRIFTLLAMSALVLTLDAAPKKQTPAWNLIPATGKPGGTYKMNCVSPEKFTVTLTPDGTDKLCQIQIVRTINAKKHAQERIFFRARSVNGEPVYGSFVLSLFRKPNAKPSVIWGPQFRVEGKKFAQYIFPLDGTFGLGDAMHHLWQLKITMTGKTGSKKPSVVEFTDFKIDTIDNLGGVSDAPDVTVTPPVHKKTEPRPDAVKVFMHFDNGDLQKIVSVKAGSAGEVDPEVPYPGFRDVLISAVRRDVRLVFTPEEADVILYSAAGRRPEIAKKIAGCVKKGTPLYASANIADPEIEALLPARVTRINEKTFPVRKSLVPVKKNDPLFAGMSRTKFGVFRKVELKEGSSVRLTFDDGSPVMVEGKAGLGKTVYSSLAFGADVIPGKQAYDPLLFRVISSLSGKKIAERELPETPEWQEGLSKDNFGRFGIALGDGLLCETVNNTLGVVNKVGQYEFRSASSQKILLPSWQLVPVTKGIREKARKINWNELFGGVGTVDLKTECVIPASWKNEKLRFCVEGGIDDTSEIYFNNKLIGKVDTATAQYWCVPHRHPIPKEIIRFGEKNSICVRVTNLRDNGGFGSAPVIAPAVTKRSAWKVAVDRCNTLGKGGVIVDENNSKRRFDTSLAFPGIRWEIFGEKITLALSNAARHAAYFRNGKWNTVDLLKKNTLPGDWEKGALLLIPEEKGNPLMLVFSKKPGRITADCIGNTVTGLSIERKGGIGMIVPVWIYGSACVNTENWEKKLPADVERRMAFWYPKAYAYPVALKEVFKIDEKGKKVRIRTTFSYHETPNDWKVKGEKIAPVSPLAWFMKDLLFHGKQVQDLGLVTNYGNFAAVTGSDTVEWSLPLPEPQLELVPKILGYEDLYKSASDCFSSGVRYIGGHRPVSTSTFALTFKPDVKTAFNIGLHMWLHGSPDTLNAPFALPLSERSKLEERLRMRALESIEQYRFKAVGHWREEPYSGVRYPLCYGSPRLHGTKFAPGTGTRFSHFDNNETVFMIYSVMRALADHHGQAEFVKANASFIRSVAALIFATDDYVIMASPCGESGQAASIDMLNCEYPGMLKLARLAEIIGDKALRDQALYRAARRMVPTLARITFRSYQAENMGGMEEDKVFGTGFNEGGYEYVSKNGNNREPSLQIYDMSQGIPPELFRLYAKYLPKEQEEYARDVMLPLVKARKPAYVLCERKLINILAHSRAAKPEEVLGYARIMMNDPKAMERLGFDFPGMTVISNLSQTLDCIAGRARILDCKDLKIEKFEFDPAKNELVLEAFSGEKPEVLFEVNQGFVCTNHKAEKNGRIVLHPVPGKKFSVKLQLKKL